MRRILTIVLIIAAIAAAGWFGYQRFGGAKAAEAPDYETVTVARGDIATTVSATGTVLPERKANLSFQSAGNIVSIPIEVGDHVEAGQVLAQLDTTDLQLAIRQAEISLHTAQIQVRQQKAGPDESDLAAAQAALESAKSAYQQLLDGPDADQLAAARASVEQARVTLSQAQQAYDPIKDMPGVGMMPQSLQLQQATINYETAQAQYRVTTKGATQSQLLASQAQVAAAQASLDRLKKGASAEQVEIAQTGVDQAELALAQARRRLDNACITAPWAGIVTTINIVEGTLAQPGASAIQIADTSRYHIDVQVDEVDITAIVEGQIVTLDVGALPDQNLSGAVAKVAPTASRNQTGGASYLVTINIDPTDAALRSGMSATATIISSSRQDVLLIPNRAVQLDRASGQTFVEQVLPDGGTQRVEVRLGLRDDQRSEVRAGLEEGDKLAIRTVSMQERLKLTLGGQ
ncbi:MAG: hypothetical protein CVU38_18125 [Chloroflexi bacterium HGW-Chloroflexi-1]|nr:MAG: hypothetical protein CVU38_18125 [Chloroflexi bacterium HGW-Chloroflexi-1]